jgi:hypothetical protein
VSVFHSTFLRQRKGRELFFNYYSSDISDLASSDWPDPTPARLLLIDVLVLTRPRSWLVKVPPMLAPLAQKRDHLWLLLLNDCERASALWADEARPLSGSLGSLSDWDI